MISNMYFHRTQHSRQKVATGKATPITVHYLQSRYCYCLSVEYRDVFWSLKCQIPYVGNNFLTRHKWYVLVLVSKMTFNGLWIDSRLMLTTYNNLVFSIVDNIVIHSIGLGLGDVTWECGIWL